MLAIARRNAIKERLQECKSVTITDLAARLDVTKETIRRDLKVMEEQGELIRTHGGAYILDGVQNELEISTRQVTCMEEKKRIAEKCTGLIRTGEILFLDNSSTAWEIARTLVDRKVTVLTNSLEIANILSASSEAHLILIGGAYSDSTKSFVGEGSIRALHQYFVDKAFISSRSVSIAHGISDTNDMAASMHRIMLEHAKEKYLVVDHSKLDFDAFSWVGPVSQLDGIVCDREFSPEWQEFLHRAQVRMY